MSTMKIGESIGEKRVRVDFNVSEDADTYSIVADIKRKSADLINMCEALKARDPRLVALAQTAYEEAAMWAVKAATG